MVLGCTVWPSPPAPLPCAREVRPEPCAGAFQCIRSCVRSYILSTPKSRRAGVEMFVRPGEFKDRLKSKLEPLLPPPGSVRAVHQAPRCGDAEASAFAHVLSQRKAPAQPSNLPVAVMLQGQAGNKVIQLIPTGRRGAAHQAPRCGDAEALAFAHVLSQRKAPAQPSDPPLPQCGRGAGGEGVQTLYEPEIGIRREYLRLR